MQTQRQHTHDSDSIPANEPSGFDVFDLPHKLAKNLEHMKYTTPTPIQVQAIPAILKNKDILASAQTGTGKTGAFVIPILTKLMLDPHAHALVMAPTRELAAQILAVAHQMSNKHPAFTTALLIGGEGMGKQRAQISAKPRLIVGTPGRMNDHLRNNPRMYMHTTVLVLDEADRMLDMGFAPQIKEIITTTNPKRQTLMFSATFPENIRKFAQQYLRDPFQIAIEPERTSAANIRHETLETTEGARYGELVKQLGAREGSIILFVKTKYGADRMAKRLAEGGHSADALHGGLNQRQRDRAIAAFRAKKTRIMVATDVAARGLDVPHIETVINYDLPQVPEDYVHRIGRTARAGKEGVALSFVMPSEKGKWRAIQRVLNPDAPRERGERDSDRGSNRSGKSYGKKRSFTPRVDNEFLEALDTDAPKTDAPASRFEKKPYGKKPFGAKSFGDKPRFDKPQGERRPYGDKPRFDKPRFDKPREDREVDGNRRDAAPQGERRPYGDKPRGDRPFAKKPYGDRPQGERRPYGDKPRFDKPRFDKPREDREVDGNRRDAAPQGERRPYGDKPRGDRPFAKKPFGDRPQGERRPYGDKPRFDKPQGERRPYGDKPREDREADGNRRDAAPQGERRPYGDKPRGDKPFGKKPFGSKPFGKKPFGKKPFGGKPSGFKKRGPSGS